MWRSPKCKAAIRILDARTVVITYPDGAEARDLEWEDENQAECGLRLAGHGGRSIRRPRCLSQLADAEVRGAHSEALARRVREVEE